MSNAIVYNGEKIELSNCLKKDPRRYYNGWIFLKSDEYEYAEFTCLPKGMVIRLTNHPEDDKFYANGDYNGKYKIPNVLFNTYHLGKTKSSQIFQINENTFFLKGRLNATERSEFEPPKVPKKEKTIYQEIDFDNLVMLNDSLSSRTIKMESEGKYIVTYCNNGQQYISIKETNDEDAEKLFSIQDLKKMYGKGFHHFYGNELSYVIETKNKDIFVSKEFFDRMKVDCTECRVLYDPEKKIIYFTPQETFSDLSGEVIDPIKETPVNVVTEEATDMEMIQALLTEFTNFKESADKLFTKYRDMEKGFSELKAENEAIKKALKEQNQTVTINNGKAYFESFEEMTL